MIEHYHAVDGDQVRINVVEHEEDLDGFRSFIGRNLKFLGLDSETAGLDIYSDKFRCRLVQFGTPWEAWVVPVELGRPYEGAVIEALGAVEGFVIQNASYDLQVFEQTLGVPMESLWPKVTDTKILAHLVDPRAYREGGVGHSLEELTRSHVDEYVADSVKTLMKDLAAEHKTTKANVWKKVTLDDPRYQLYSGMDPILAARLLRKLLPLVPGSSSGLLPYEHKLAEICSYMERTGFLLDVEYSEELASKLRYEESRQNEIALSFGCENLNSTEAVADVIEQNGVQIKGRTPSGKRQVNEQLLEQVADGPDGNASRFAQAIVAGKRAGKWRKTWVQKFLDNRDSDNRCHASINPLQARTARMSITGIPAQTLPAGDWMVRRCFIADPGQSLVSVDYQAQELRVLAALSGDEVMQQAFKNDADLHQLTADASGVDRKIGKMVNFAYVYGSGPANIAQQGGIPFPVAKRVIEGFEATYPKVKELSQRLQLEASRSGHITTPFGRRLPVDPTRAYSALNYVVQSASRDITCEALLRLHEDGYTPYMRLPVHDEVIACVPTEHAQWGAQQIGKIMATEFRGVWIGTDPEVIGKSWGHGYGAPD